MPPPLPARIEGFGPQDMQAMLQGEREYFAQMMQWLQGQLRQQPTPAAAAATPTDWVSQAVKLLPVLNLLFDRLGSVAQTQAPNNQDVAGMIAQMNGIVGLAKALMPEAPAGNDGDWGKVIEGDGGMKVVLKPDGSPNMGATAMLGIGTGLEKLQSLFAMVMAMRQGAITSEQAQAMMRQQSMGQLQGMQQQAVQQAQQQAPAQQQTQQQAPADQEQAQAQQEEGGDEWD